MKRVYQAQNPTDAHLLKDILDTQDIEAIVKGDFIWGARGLVPDTPETCPSVWIVDDEDYEIAIEVVRGYQPGATPTGCAGSEWKCETCGEIIEGQFSECWQCGKERKQNQ
jgi:hypothetical protein